MRRERQGRSAAYGLRYEKGAVPIPRRLPSHKIETKNNVVDISTGAPVDTAPAPQNNAMPTSPDAPPAETLPEMLPDTPPTEPEELPTTEPDAPISATQETSEEKPKLSFLQWLFLGSVALMLWRLLRK